MLPQSDFHQGRDVNGTANARQPTKCSRNVNSFISHTGLFPGRATRIHKGVHVNI